MSFHKRVLLGISGGIAAYKSLILIRLLVKKGYQVKVVCTRNALEFITPLSVETLSGNSLYVDMFDTKGSKTTEHTSLADWADFAILAPATANIIGKLANGIADDALSTVLLAFDKPIFFAPAMNEKMYEHPAVQANIQRLISFSYHCIEPTEGFLACHAQGKGRMAEPEDIFTAIEKFFSNVK